MPSETKPNDELQREKLVYSYTYTSDDENGENPQSNTLKVITTVEEETTPDGTKVVRKKEESQQISQVRKIEKITRVHHHAIDPLTGEHIREDDPRYKTLINQLTNKSLHNNGKKSFDPNIDVKTLQETMKQLALDCESNGLSKFNGNEPENNKSKRRKRKKSAHEMCFMFE